ncbi:MAG TPA: TSUP family transporter, partial [Steroidobacteraceae bacterium]
QRRREPRLGRVSAAGAQLCISIYGGYFGGGIGFLMLAALTACGIVLRAAGATKNVLAAAMNASAVAIFLFSPEVRWVAAAVSGAGAIIGGIAGGLMLHRVNEKALRAAIVVIGLLLTVSLFQRASH